MFATWLVLWTVVLGTGLGLTVVLESFGISRPVAFGIAIPVVFEITNYTVGYLNGEWKYPFAASQEISCRCTLWVLMTQFLIWVGLNGPIGAPTSVFLPFAAYWLSQPERVRTHSPEKAA